MAAVQRYDTIMDWLEEIPSVEIAGLCDDAYCPNCGRGFVHPWENDAERCPLCRWKVNWDKWHRMNDEEKEDD